MTQAFNLSQFANNVNSSGQASLTSAVTGTLPVGNGGTGGTTQTTAKVALAVITGVNGSEILPSGNTSQRDSSPLAGYIRFNTDSQQFEGYNGTSWTSVGGGATGGGTDQVFVLNGQTVNYNYTIPLNQNAMCAGPIAIATGVSVTVSDGSNWVIV